MRLTKKDKKKKGNKFAPELGIPISTWILNVMYVVIEFVLAFSMLSSGSLGKYKFVVYAVAAILAVGMFLYIFFKIKKQEQKTAKTFQITIIEVVVLVYQLRHYYSGLFSGVIFFDSFVLRQICLGL